ncbi:hypothetical protein QLL95_gp0606 [Cotonvirus japonicus]|uniref:DUF4203 domain-containing protein n=1 Tax=Cotonvirus japonicus TaxID=2811091 RepID=A0ABM7NTW4_9VIRU|nr:hypothetical protein QLL95_gp0606 [Cotonvirus japonicus]BCS83517.1 hypothetical protein [Cotonvirus japonicus]
MITFPFTLTCSFIGFVIGFVTSLVYIISLKIYLCYFIGKNLEEHQELSIIVDGCVFGMIIGLFLSVIYISFEIINNINTHVYQWINRDHDIV